MTTPTPSDEIFTEEVLAALRDAKAFDGPVKLSYDSGPYSIAKPTIALQNLYAAIASPFKRDLAARDAELAALKAELASVRAALKLANDSCRSAYQIASRAGAETDWETWKFALGKSLKEQHKVMYPGQYTDERKIRAHDGSAAFPKEGA